MGALDLYAEKVLSSMLPFLQTEAESKVKFEQYGGTNFDVAAQVPYSQIDVTVVGIQSSQHRVCLPARYN